MTGNDFADAINATEDGWIRANGVTFTRATHDEVVAEMTVCPQHLQALGMVHGGVWCALIESVASVGANIDAIHRGLLAVGLENHTSFLRACRGGKITVTGKPLHNGRRNSSWQVDVTDEKGRTVATGRVRLACLEPGTSVGGEDLAIREKG